MLYDKDPISPTSVFPIDSDVLTDLVRKAFCLTQRRHTIYYKMFNENCIKNDPAKVCYYSSASGSSYVLSTIFLLPLLVLVIALTLFLLLIFFLFFFLLLLLIVVLLLPLHLLHVFLHLFSSSTPFPFFFSMTFS